MMAAQTTQLEMPCGSRMVVLAIKSNGGSVSVEKPVGNSWVVADIYTEDGAHVLYVGGGRVRFTPAGGAAFEVS